MLFRKFFHDYLLILIDTCMYGVKKKCPLTCIYSQAYVFDNIYIHIYIYTYIYIYIYTYTCTSNVLLFEKFFHDFLLVLENVKAGPCGPVVIGCEDNLCFYKVNFFCFFF